MKIPNQLSRNTIKALGLTDEFAIRVLLHSVSNNGPARIRCRGRQYVFEKHPQTGVHTLDIPQSLWMGGVNPGRYRAQGSICDDFRELKGAAFTIHLIRLKDSTAAPDAPKEETSAPDQGGILNELRRLLTALGAPDEVEQAFEMIDAGANEEELSIFVNRTIADIVPDDAAPPANTPPTSSAQDRAAKMREAKAKKKAEREAAANNLQPA